jgi:hypothetical protein
MAAITVRSEPRCHGGAIGFHAHAGATARGASGAAGMTVRRLIALAGCARTLSGTPAR